MPENTDELLERIETLERLVQSLQSQRGNFMHPFAPVFLARAPSSDDGDNPASSGFIEQSVNGGQVTDYGGGRKCLVDDDPAALVEPGDAFAVIEIPDFDDAGNAVSRYVPIRSASVVAVRVTGNQPGGGKYNGKIYTGSIKPADDTAWLAAGLAMPEDGLSLPQDEDCIVINLLENNETSHAITAAGAAQKLDLDGWRIGTLNDGRAIVAVKVSPIYSCVTS